jgi:peptidoglycan/LPS O-acetylase OafA/YrhL
VAVLYHDDGSREALERNGSRLLMLAATLLVVGELTTRGFYREGPATLTYGHLILDVAFACLVVAAIAGQGLSTRWFQKLLSNAPMRAIGKYSFGMYVIHYPINRYLTRPWMEALQPSRPAGIAYACLMVLISFLLAMASFHLLEKPFLRLRAYFQPLPPATGSA